MTGRPATLAADIAAYEAHLARHWQDRDGAHDLAHIRRVWRNACAIVKTDTLSVNWSVLAAATYFHDLINLPKDAPDRHLAAQKSADAAAAYLRETGFAKGDLPAVSHAINAHSFSAGVTPQTTEAQVLRDADRLDALGAIGLARVFQVSGALGRAIYHLDDPFAARRAPDDSRFTIDHFPTKLLRLADDMCTDAGRRMAIERTKVLRAFLENLRREITVDHSMST